MGREEEIATSKGVTHSPMDIVALKTIAFEKIWTSQEIPHHMHTALLQDLRQRAKSTEAAARHYKENQTEDKASTGSTAAT